MENPFEEKQVIVLVDLDPIIYKVAFDKKQTKEDIVKYGDQKDRTWLDVKKELDIYITNLFEATKATHYIGALTSGKCFRYDIYPEYKAHRKDFQKPRWFNEVKTAMFTEYKGVHYKGLEADDILTICHKKFPGSILCSSDKDMLQSVGNHYNYNKNEHRVIASEEADYLLWTQVLTGDSTDNIKGLKGVGTVGAKQILERTQYGQPSSSVVLDAYTKQLGEDLGIREFYKNYKLIKLLEYEEYDFQIPEPIEVKSIININVGGK